FARKLHRREIDRDRAGNAALSRVAAGGAQRPFSHLEDGLILFRKWDEFAGRDDAALGMLPAHQRFGAADLAVAERGLQLVVQRKLVATGSILQVTRQGTASALLVVHLLMILRDRAALPGLAAIHRELGVAQ